MYNFIAIVQCSNKNNSNDPSIDTVADIIALNSTSNIEFRHSTNIQLNFS